MATQHKTCLLTEEEIKEIEEIQARTKTTFSSIAGLLVTEALQARKKKAEQSIDAA